MGLPATKRTNLHEKYGASANAGNVSACRATGFQSKAHQSARKVRLPLIGLHTVFEHREVMGSPALQAFIHEYRLPFPIGIDQADETGPLPVTMSQWGLRGTPSVVLLDRQGRARLHRFGVVDDLVLGAAIGQLLAESPAVAASVLPDRVGTGKARPACDGEGCVSQ